MKKNSAYIIGIAGGSASGKTTFLQELCKRFDADELALVSQDNYYKAREEQQLDQNGEINFDLPSAIDLDRFASDLKKLSEGTAIHKTEYTFNNDEKSAKTIIIEPAKVIITEGLFVFHYEEIAAMMNHKVYFHADDELRLGRRIKRDQNERGYPESDVRYRWKNHVRPADQQFLEPHRDGCDRVIINNISFHQELDELERFIRSIIDQ